MKSRDRVQQIILWAAIEDFTGLWGILWELNTVFPGKKEENLELAKKRIEDYLKTEVVTLYSNIYTFNDYREIELDKSVELIGISENWKAPFIGEKYYCLSATEKGKREYYL